MIVLENDQLDPIEIEVVPAVVHGKTQGFLAVALAAILFLADPNSELGGAVHAVDAIDLHKADNGRLDRLADGENDFARVLTEAIPPLPVRHHVYRPIGKIEARGGDVVSPTEQRAEILGHEWTDGDPACQQHGSMAR